MQDISVLGIHDQGFMVASMIERCPKTMMLRELLVNALEAASGDPSGQGRVRIFSQMVDGVRKLALWNNGIGLDAAELDQICDLASSLKKVTGLDQNFGMGAKVASLPSNRHGLRYRSCKDGRVNEVVLGQRQGLYGRLLHPGPDGPQAVADVTEVCRADGIDTTQDWTEVVLMGNHADQDTVLDPYDGNPVVPANWLGAVLRDRFYRLPERVQVLVEDVQPGQPARPLRPFGQEQRSGSLGQTVQLPSGVSVAFRFDPPPSGQPLAASAGDGLACVVHKGEIYDMIAGRQWGMDSPLCGIAFGAKFISIHILLPDSYPVLPEAYREFLRFRGGDQRKVGVRDFGRAVHAAIPDWLRAIIQQFGPRDAEFAAEIDGELRRLITELALLPEDSIPAGDDEGAPAASREAAVHDEKQPAPQQAEETAPPDDEVPPGTPSPPSYAKPPEIIVLRTAEDVMERELDGWAARYYVPTNQLFVNVQYQAVRDLSGRLQDAVGAMDLPPEAVTSSADALAEWAAVRKVARATIYCLSKRRGNWPAEAIQRALSVEALSIAAEDHADRFDELVTMLRERLGEAAQAA